MGPIALFDKSFLQTLSTDQSVWFDHFFYPVICPTFFIETLADLEKPPREGKTAEEEVGIIAAKTPEMSGAPCHFHYSLYVNDLLGNHVPLNGQIPAARSKAVSRNGKIGTLIDQPEESKAFHRWKRHSFNEIERHHARQWRAQLQAINLGKIEHAMNSAGIDSKSCRTLSDAKAIAVNTVKGTTKSPGRFYNMLNALEISPDLHQTISQRWKRLHKPPLAVFAPYAAHILTAELYFRAGMGAGLIASTRASHRVDMSYIFYLPFCSIFISNDKFHRTHSEQFLRSDQAFVWGEDLKRDLKQIDEYYKALPKDVTNLGIYKFATHLPEECTGAIRGLFERYTPSLLRAPDVPVIDKAANKKLVDEMKAWQSAKEIPLDNMSRNAEMETLILERSVTRTKGSWTQIGPEVKDEE